jgi:hypothetical protein
VSRLICFETDSPEGFIEWTLEAKERIKTSPVGVVFSDLSYKIFVLDDRSIIILVLNFSLPNVIPSYFFRVLLRKVLKFKSVKISFLNYKKALIEVVKSDSKRDL